MPNKAATTRPMAKCRADGFVKTSADDAIPDLLFLFHVYPNLLLLLHHYATLLLGQCDADWRRVIKMRREKEAGHW